MTDDDAVYAAALHRYIEEALAMRGESLTAKAEKSIRAIGASLGIRPERTTLELGFETDFSWSLEAIRWAKNRVRVTRTAYLVDMLYAVIADTDVNLLESYSGSSVGHELAAVVAGYHGTVADSRGAR